MLSSLATLFFCVAFLTVDARAEEICTVGGIANYTCTQRGSDPETCVTTTSIGCPTNATKFCGAYKKKSAGRYIRSGTPTTYLDLLELYQVKNGSTDGSMERVGNIWVLSNRSNWIRYSGNKVNATYYEEQEEFDNYGEHDLLAEPAGDDGYDTALNSSVPKNFTVDYNYHYHLDDNFSYFVQSSIIAVRVSCAGGVKYSLIITLPGDLTTLSDNQKTALKASITANIVAYTTLSLDDIEEVILSAGSIKATVIFKESVSKAQSDSAKSDLAAASAKYMVGTTAVEASDYTVSTSSASILKHNMLMSISFVLMTLAILY